MKHLFSLVFVAASAALFGQNISSYMPTCAEPTNLSVSNIFATSFDFSWISVDNNFNVEWGPAGFGPGTGSTFAVTGTQGTTTTTVTMTGQGSTIALMPNTSYDVYVQTNCGSSTSVWEGPLTVTTQCLATAPWMEDFDSLSTGTANRFGCWSQDQSSANPRWYADNGGTPSLSTGPSVDNTTGTSSGIYMYFESSSPASLGDTNSLLSPMIDVTALTTPYLEFYYHMFGATMGNLHVDVYDDINGWQRDVILLSGQQTASQTAPYDKAAATLNTAASSVQIRFRGVRGSDFYGDMAIDDFSVIEAPTAGVNNRGCIVCDQYAAGVTFSLDSGATWYTAVDRPLLETMRDNGSDLSKVCVSLVTDMTSLFASKSSFNQDISSWDVSNVTNMKKMFRYAQSFNQDIGNWDVSNVTDMSSMFERAYAFNQDIGAWDVSNVTDMSSMFRGWHNILMSFNGDISTWDVSSVIDFSQMFEYCDSFNQPIGNWDVSNVTNMFRMFRNALAFNQDIGSWDVSNVTDMTAMLKGTSSFNEDLSNWCVTNIPTQPYNFSFNSPLTAANHPVWGSCPCQNQLDSISSVNHAKGIYQSHFDGLASNGSYSLEWKLSSDTIWRSKALSRVSLINGIQKFNVSPWFNDSVDIRITKTGSAQARACTTTIAIPCKPLTIQTVEQESAFCQGDSALVRVNYAGGRGVKSILWSNGATTKRTHAQQKETLSVTVTDATGCSVTDSITASALSTATAPTGLTITSNGAIITASWNSSQLSSSQSLIGYKLNYRLRNTQTWNKTPLTTNTSYTMNWTGSGIPAGNYEFVVFARYRENGVATNSNFSCITLKGYNGVGGKSEGADAAEPTDVPNISVYPNPTDNILYVQAPENSSLILVDMNGKTLTQLTTETVETAIDMSSYAQGVYMLQIQTGEAVETRRIVRN